MAQLILVAVAAAAFAAWRTFAARQTTPPASKGFRDGTASSGLDFHMSFLSDEQGEQFKINLYDHGAGLIVGDYNGDGFDDVLFLNQFGRNGLYFNRGDGRFENVTALHPAVALGDRVCVGGACGDYDNDGDQDLYVTSTRGGNVLLENLRGEGFRDATERAGVGCIAHSEAAAFFDYDNDGFLDLLVTNTAHWTSNEYNAESRHYLGPAVLYENVWTEDDFEQNLLFRNNRDGTFTEVSAEAGVRGHGWSGDVAVFDFDGDGDLDLFLGNMFGSSQLLANDGQGRFADTTDETLKRVSFGAMGCKALDYDNDGRLDLFVTDMHSDMWMGYGDYDLIEPRRKYRYFTGPKAEEGAAGRQKERAFAELFGLGYERVLFGNTLYRNEGGGAFTEISDEANFETFWPWGIASGDFDNDGYEDVFLPSGMGFPFFYSPSQLLMNQEGRTFVEQANRHGIEPPAGGILLPVTIRGKDAVRSSRCAATADFDGDGKLDLIVNNFNDRPYYLRNQFPEANFVEFRLKGTKSNRDAIGAVMTLRCGQGLLVRQVHCAGGYLSQSSKTLHFGLGAIDKVDRAEVRWPSGIVQTVDVPQVNRLYEVRENAE